MARTRRGALAALAALALTAVSAQTATAAFPGLNGLIAVGRDDQIVVKAPGDLTGGTALTSLGLNSDPEWSPDGLRIAFISTRGGTADVWVMNTDGSDQRQLTQEPADAEAPSWSPDGTRIAFTASANSGNDDVAVIPFVGTGARLVVAGGSGIQSLPVWTPDGSRIVFQDDTVGGLSIVGATGAGRTAFLSDSAQPDFSPDGTRLVVRRTDAERLHVVNADGSGGAPILENQPATRPVWSPDGTRVLYHRFFGSMPPNYRLYTVASGGGTQTPESNAPGLNFAPDWQAIGPPPVIRALSPLSAGTPGATLTVDGTGFVRRSVVRWNGADRPTTFVGTTRLAAALGPADVAAPGSAQVAVFTPPSGGGLSPPAVAAVSPPPPPPPRILLGTAKLVKVTWTRSRVRGKLRIAGTLERAGRIEVALVQTGRVAQRARLTLPVGPFSRSLTLARTLRPGRYVVRLSELGAPAGAGLVGAERRVVLPAPREGVVATTFVSAILNGPPARTLRDKSRVFAHFRFVARPRAGLALTTRWIRPDGASKTDGKPFRRLLTSFVSQKPRLSRGVWRCELRAGRTVVAVASVRIR